LIIVVAGASLRYAADRTETAGGFSEHGPRRNFLPRACSALKEPKRRLGTETGGSPQYSNAPDIRETPTSNDNRQRSPQRPPDWPGWRKSSRRFSHAPEYRLIFNSAIA
jgi:hypothetical protein